MIYNSVSTCRTCQGLEICKDPLGIKHGKLGNPPKKRRIPLEKKRECVDFHDFHGSQLLEMISPKYQSDFYMGA